MGRVGIRYDDVVQSAVALLGRGENPSVQKVRALLGTGSNSTIAAHLKRWQQELADRPRSILPPTLPESVSAVFEQCWRSALDAAEQGYNQLKEQALHDVGTAQQARDAALQAQRAAADETEGLQRRIAALTHEHERLQNQFLEERERRRATEQALLATEKRVVEAREAVEQIRRETELRVAATEQLFKQEQDESRTRFNEVSKRLEYERERGEASETRLYALLDQVRNELRQERAQRETERLAWQTTERNYRERIAGLGQALVEAQRSGTMLDKRIKEMTVESNEFKKVLRNRETRHLRMTRLVNALRVRLAETQATNKSLSQRLKNSQDYAESLVCSFQTQPRGKGDPDER